MNKMYYNKVLMYEFYLDNDWSDQDKLSSSNRRHSPALDSLMFTAPQTGFSLIELLVVIAIIGVLSAIALPSYQNSVMRSGRAEAKAELLQVASEEERFFSSNNTYSADATPLNTADGIVRTTQNALFTITVAACGGGIATCFIATATAQNQQLGDACNTLTITNTGVRGSTGDNPQECWQR
jgi:type IV pilus assembly protein PilE